MSYVSIWRPVHDEIVEASRNAKNEIIGLLLGRLESDTIIVDASVTGEFETQKNRVTLPGETLARIADDVVNGRLKGSIVGWYHSHVEGGLFLSDTDIQTQKKLQQFSPLVTAIVVDSSTGSVGYFRVDPQTARQTRIPEDNILIFNDPSEAVPSERKGKPAIRATPTVELRGRPPQIRQPTQKLAIAILLVALVASIAIIGALFLRPQTPIAFAIVHSPIRSATVGTPLDVKANITGTVRTVTLLYSTGDSDSFTEVQMRSVVEGEYAYTIPPEHVKGNFVYYIKAVDVLGSQQETNKYAIPVADFAIDITRPVLTIYRNGSSSLVLGVQKINGFNEPISLSASGVPPGVIVSFGSNPIASESTEATVNVVAEAGAQIGTFTMALSGAYGPPQAPLVLRQALLQITIADFDIQVTPSSRNVSPGGTATFTVTVTIAQGFTDPVKVTVEGLPQGSSYKLLTTGPTATVGAAGTTVITLEITTTASIRSGSYALTITATGAGLIHRQTIQLIVR